ncbi:hypothetical protein B0H10DRAFT_2046765 [Mycena sp. CBHHK59/15]|nr:hypothetical protein B0H10DRAFT_2046765 [Mycena sp. CBHHK59/15]
MGRQGAYKRLQDFILSPDFSAPALSSGLTFLAMQFTLKLNFVAALAALVVSAAPAAPETRSALVDGHVFICTDANFAGDCTNYGFFVDQCSNFPDEFQDDISSFGSDAGWSCTMYTDINCNGDTYTGTNPGFATLPAFLNDVFSSVHCEHI